MSWFADDPGWFNGAYWKTHLNLKAAGWLPLPSPSLVFFIGLLSAEDPFDGPELKACHGHEALNRVRPNSYWCWRPRWNRWSFISKWWWSVVSPWISNGGGWSSLLHCIGKDRRKTRIKLLFVLLDSPCASQPLVAYSLLCDNPGLQYPIYISSAQ